jgi:putative colanic acid biosynthesis UDP-glucose lipid carrier transferase
MKQRDLLSRTPLIYQLILIAIDILMLCVSCVVCYWLVFSNYQMELHYNVALLFSCLLAGGLFALTGLYDLNSQRYGYPVLLKITGGLVATYAVLMIMAFFLKVTTDFSRFWLGSWFMLAIVLIYIGRIFSSLLIYMINGGWLPQRTAIIIGDGVSVLKTRERLLRWGYSNVSVVGCFYESNNELSSALERSGSMNDAYDYIDNNSVDQIWIAFDLTKNANDAQQALDRLNESLPEVKVVPYVSDMRLSNNSIEVVAGMPVLNLSMSPFHGLNKIIKLLEDKVFSMLLLVILSPLFLLVAILVKLSSPGPIIYSQKRMSWNGKKFDIYKFRSMPVGTENNTGAVWSAQNEPRATRIGTFLRKTSMDELPQFYNVLKGDMSIVGPRPERPIFVNQFRTQVPGYMLKHKVNAGITGWAQACGYRGDTDLAKRIDCDLHYIENWSLIFDLKIILITAMQVFKPKFFIDAELKNG